MAQEPNEYLLIRNLQAALQQIAVASGYHHTVAATSIKLNPDSADDAFNRPDGPRPFALLEVRPERWEYFPSLEVRLVQPVIVHFVGDSTPTSDESRIQTFYRLCADIERAIAVDPGRGGYAIDTRIVRRTLHSDDVDGKEVQASVELEMPLRRTYGAPDVTV
jgi:hypothetical protein